MRDLCHRCQRELPDRRPAGSELSPATLDDVILFCPFCAAPQVRLPEYMHPEQPAGEHPGSTGALPPPRPNARMAAQARNFIDWRIVLRVSSVVALAAAVTTTLMLAVPNPAVQAFASLLDWLLVLSGAVLAVGVYARQAPGARLNAMLGMRIGLVTGLLMVGARVLAIAIVGVFARFVMHSLGPLDAELTHQTAALQAQVIASLQDRGASSREAQETVAAMLSSPEMRGGLGLMVAAVFSSFALLFSAAGGAFAGLLRAPRPGLRSTE